MTKGQLFQFDGTLYEQVDGVAMGSPVGPLLANVFMCSVEEGLKHEGKLPVFYRRYVDDTLTIMPDVTAAISFLNTLNHAHDAVNFTMELETSAVLPFLGVSLINKAPRVETKVYVKPTNTGLLLHHHSHVDNRYKKGILTTMLDRAYRLSSTWAHFSEECERLRGVFLRLKYLVQLIDSVIKQSINAKISDHQSLRAQPTEDAVRFILPFKDQPVQLMLLEDSFETSVPKCILLFSLCL